MLKKVWLTVFFFILIGIQIGGSPLRVHAQTTENKSIPYWGPILSCEGSQEQVDKANQAGATEIKKVCTNLCDLFATAQNGLFFLLTIIAFVFIPLMLVVGGLMVILGGAYPKWVTTGKGMIYGAVGGAALALSSFLIINTILYVISVRIDDSGTGKSGIVWGNIQCHVAPAKSLQYDTPTGGNPDNGGASIPGAVPTGCPTNVCGGTLNCAGPGGCQADEKCAYDSSQKYSCQKVISCPSTVSCGGDTEHKCDGACTDKKECQLQTNGTRQCVINKDAPKGILGQSCRTGIPAQNWGACDNGLVCSGNNRCILAGTCVNNGDCAGGTYSVCVIVDSSNPDISARGRCFKPCTGTGGNGQCPDYPANTCAKDGSTNFCYSSTNCPPGFHTETFTVNNNGEEDVLGQIQRTRCVR